MSGLVCRQSRHRRGFWVMVMRRHLTFQMRCISHNYWNDDFVYSSRRTRYPPYVVYSGCIDQHPSTCSITTNPHPLLAQRECGSICSVRSLLFQVGAPCPSLLNLPGKKLVNYSLPFNLQNSHSSQLPILQKQQQVTSPKEKSGVASNLAVDIHQKLHEFQFDPDSSSSPSCCRNPVGPSVPHAGFLFYGRPGK